MLSHPNDILFLDPYVDPTDPSFSSSQTPNAAAAAAAARVRQLRAVTSISPPSLHTPPSSTFLPFYLSPSSPYYATSSTRRSSAAKAEPPMYLDAAEIRYRTWALTERWRPLSVGELVVANIDSGRGREAEPQDSKGNWVLSKVEPNAEGVGFKLPEQVVKNVIEKGVLQGVYGMSEAKLRRFGLCMISILIIL